jgi:hypothetical protein
MRLLRAGILPICLMSVTSGLSAQELRLQVPQTIAAGSAFQLVTSGGGPKATLLISGPGGALSRSVQPGETVSINGADLYNAGVYVAVLAQGSSSAFGTFTILPARQPQSISFLARPSRLPVGLHDGINGSAYIFDAYHNLITTPMPVSFDLSTATATAQSRTVTSREGVAWTAMDSATRQGSARFVAHVGDVLSTHVVDQVPGDPCGLNMTAHPDGKRVVLETAPVKDCSGNPVPDGTVVTFTESYGGEQSTVDAPLKQGIARAEMPSVPGARISVASGVVAGNEIRWDGAR